MFGEDNRTVWADNIDGSLNAAFTLGGTVSHGYFVAGIDQNREGVALFFDKAVMAVQTPKVDTNNGRVQAVKQILVIPQGAELASAAGGLVLGVEDHDQKFAGEVAEADFDVARGQDVIEVRRFGADGEDLRFEFNGHRKEVSMLAVINTVLWAFDAYAK